jgi:lipoprotein-anchoring transpeptidase ErfK/SrfK
VNNVSSGAIDKSRKRFSPGSLALILAIFSLLMTSVMPSASQPAAAQSSDWAPPATVYIPETGHTLDRLFLDLWRNAGGASAFGYPITPEITLENGHVVQYLQYARFEYWPEGDEHGNTVILGKLGEELRPVMLQRSMIASSKPAQSGDLQESAAMMKAWLPVEAESTETTLFVEATGHTIKTGFLDFWYNSGAENYLGNPLTEEYTLDGVIYQVFERGQLQYSAETGVTMVPVGQVLAQKYKLDTEPMAQGDLPTYDEALFIPPPEPTAAPRVAAAGNGETWIDINLSYEYMTVYQGDVVVMETYISSGKPGFETPPGTYYINTKLESQTMEGVLGGEYYHVPDVPWVMYFTDVGHAIHGAYWHNNFGTPMSHGCINVPMDLAAYLYSVSPIGTRVEIHW